MAPKQQQGKEREKDPQKGAAAAVSSSAGSSRGHGDGNQRGSGRGRGRGGQDSGSAKHVDPVAVRPAPENAKEEKGRRPGPKSSGSAGPSTSASPATGKADRGLLERTSTPPPAGAGGAAVGLGVRVGNLIPSPPPPPQIPPFAIPGNPLYLPRLFTVKIFAEMLKMERDNLIKFGDRVGIPVIDQALASAGGGLAEISASTAATPTKVTATAASPPIDDQPMPLSLVHESLKAMKAFEAKLVQQIVKCMHGLKELKELSASAATEDQGRLAVARQRTLALIRFATLHYTNTGASGCSSTQKLVQAVAKGCLFGLNQQVEPLVDPARGVQPVPITKADALPLVEWQQEIRVASLYLIAALAQSPDMCFLYWEGLCPEVPLAPRSSAVGSPLLAPFVYGGMKEQLAAAIAMSLLVHKTSPQMRMGVEVKVKSTSFEAIGSRVFKVLNTMFEAAILVLTNAQKASATTPASSMFQSYRLALSPVFLSWVLPQTPLGTCPTLARHLRTELSSEAFVAGAVAPAHSLEYYGASCLVSVLWRVESAVKVTSAFLFTPAGQALLDSAAKSADSLESLRTLLGISRSNQRSLLEVLKRWTNEILPRIEPIFSLPLRATTPEELRQRTALELISNCICESFEAPSFFADTDGGHGGEGPTGKNDKDDETDGGQGKGKDEEEGENEEARRGEGTPSRHSSDAAGLGGVSQHSRMTGAGAGVSTVNTATGTSSGPNTVASRYSLLADKILLDKAMYDRCVHNCIEGGLTSKHDETRALAFRTLGRIREDYTAMCDGKQRREWIERLSAASVEPANVVRGEAFTAIRLWSVRPSFREFWPQLAEITIRGVYREMDGSVKTKATGALEGLGQCAKQSLAQLQRPMPVSHLVGLVGACFHCIAHSEPDALSVQHCYKALGLLLSGFQEEDLIIEIEGNEEGIANAVLLALLDGINGKDIKVRTNALLGLSEALRRPEVFAADPPTARTAVERLLTCALLDSVVRNRCVATHALSILTPLPAFAPYIRRSFDTAVGVLRKTQEPGGGGSFRRQIDKNFHQQQLMKDVITFYKALPEDQRLELASVFTGLVGHLESASDAGSTPGGPSGSVHSGPAAEGGTGSGHQQSKPAPTTPEASLLARLQDAK